jgi:hypothetical protein
MQRPTRGTLIEEEDLKVRRILVMAISVILAVAVAAPAVSAQSAGSDAQASGQIAELSAAWWQHVSSLPTGTNPTVGSYKANSPKCEGLVNGTFFLAGATSGDPVVRSCTVPADTQIFFPVVTIVCGEVFNDPANLTDKQLASYCEKLFNQFTRGGKMFATVDGEPVPIECTTSPIFEATVVKNNPFGSPGGTSKAVAVGCYVLLEPLSPGEHTLTFGISGSPFEQNITYHLTVV